MLTTYRQSGIGRVLARQGGVTLIEIMITLIIASVLMFLALPAFQQMMGSTRTKGAAESILSGLRHARSEAIKRNAPMRFQLVSTLDSGCAFSTTSILWVVTQTDQVARGDPEGLCDATPFTPKDDEADPCNAADDPKWPTHPAGNPVCANDPFIAAKSSPVVPSTVQVAADEAIITFGPLGQVLSNFDGTDSMAQVDITSTIADVVPWRILVATGGSVRMCNAGPDIAVGNPLKCP